MQISPSKSDISGVMLRFTSQVKVRLAGLCSCAVIVLGTVHLRGCSTRGTRAEWVLLLAPSQLGLQVCQAKQPWMQYRNRLRGSNVEPWPTMSPWLLATIFDSINMERVDMCWLYCGLTLTYWYHIQIQLHMMSMHFLCFAFSSETDEIYKFISSQKLLLPSRHSITAAILSQIWSVEVPHGKICFFNHCTSHYVALFNIWLLFM